MSSSYTDGTRVALDITDSEMLNNDTISKIIKSIKETCGEDVPLSTHLVETTSYSWESVTKYDPFFESVVCVDGLSTFIERIKESRKLTGLDVAIYILSKIKCTHLSLEKLVYFAYADYLCEYSKRLFDDTVFAFRHGPVVDSVFKKYNGSGSQYLTSFEIKNDSSVLTDVPEMSAKSRILFAEDGAEKIRSIDKTIEKYGKCSASFLVDLTHRSSSPWSHVDSSKSYQVITDDLIKEFHINECLTQ